MDCKALSWGLEGRFDGLHISGCYVSTELGIDISFTTTLAVNVADLELLIVVLLWMGREGETSRTTTLNLWPPPSRSS